MSAIIGKIRNFFSDTGSRISAVDYSNLDKLSISGIPVFTYGLIGITTVVLASYTILDSGDGDDESDEGKDESMLDKLPTVEGIKESLTKLSPFNSSESNTESEPEPQPEPEEKSETPTTGGKKNHKNRRNKTHRNKSKKSKKNRTNKSK